jgi:hypothetical protein
VRWGRWGSCAAEKWFPSSCARPLGSRGPTPRVPGRSTPGGPPHGPQRSDADVAGCITFRAAFHGPTSGWASMRAKLPPRCHFAPPERAVGPHRVRPAAPGPGSVPHTAPKCPTRWRGLFLEGSLPPPFLRAVGPSMAASFSGPRSPTVWVPGRSAWAPMWVRGSKQPKIYPEDVGWGIRGSEGIRSFDSLRRKPSKPYRASGRVDPPWTPPGPRGPPPAALKRRSSLVCIDS